MASAAVIGSFINLSIYLRGAEHRTRLRPKQKSPPDGYQEGFCFYASELIRSFSLLKVLLSSL
jgi:hypothetical protein